MASKEKEIPVLTEAVEEKVSNEIGRTVQEQNLTETVIANLKQEYGELAITGQEDKAGYLRVQEARKNVKAIRVAAEKVFEKGREEAKLVVKKWIDKEKEVVGLLEAIEKPLYKMEKDYEEERDRIKAERVRAIELQGIGRIRDMTKFGAQLDGDMWVLGDVRFEAALVKEVDAEVYVPIYEAFEAEFNIREQAQIEQQRQQEEQRQQLQSQQDEITRQRKELEDQKKQIRDGLLAVRKTQLTDMGMEKASGGYMKLTVFIANTVVEQYLDKPQAEWEAYLEQTKTDIAEAHVKHDEQQEKLKKQREELAEKVRVETIGITRRAMLRSVGGSSALNDFGLGELTDEVFKGIYDDSKSVHDAKLKEEEDNKMSDKEKWAQFVQLLKDNPVPTMRSGQYRQKAIQAKDLTAKIIQL